MKKKIFAITTLLVAILAFSTSCAFANTNMVNTVEHAAQNVTSAAGNMLNRGATGVQNAVNAVTTGVQNTTNAVRTTGNNTAATTKTTTNNKTNTNAYTATRTNTGTFLGMNETAWTWVIMGIVGVAIVALVWFYASQRDRTSNHTNE